MMQMISKLRYLNQEMFGDLFPNMIGTFEFYVTILLYIFSFWFSIYVHYVSQYLFVLVSYTSYCVPPPLHVTNPLPLLP